MGYQAPSPIQMILVEIRHLSTGHLCPTPRTLKTHLSERRWLLGESKRSSSASRCAAPCPLLCLEQAMNSKGIFQQFTGIVDHRQQHVDSTGSGTGGSFMPFACHACCGLPVQCQKHFGPLGRQRHSVPFAEVPAERSRA